jgi:undecaprenyl-diphosphatase
MSFLLEIDRKIFLWFNGLRNPWLDYVLGWPTYLGLMSITLTSIFIWMLFFDKKHRFRKYLGFLLSMLAIDAVVQILKWTIGRARPYHFFTEDPTLVNILFAKPLTHSFPSGHTSAAFSAAVLMSALYGPKCHFLYAIAALVGISRIYVGVHYPSDVLAGALIGVLGANLALRLLKRKMPDVFVPAPKKN